MGHVYKVLGKKTLPDKCDYYNNRLIVEFCENIHIHYRNLRIEFSHKEFTEFWRLINKAFKEFQKYMISKASLKRLKLEDINPFDGGHQSRNGYFYCGEAQKEHEEGIKDIKQKIKNGDKISPIAVVPVKNKPYKYQRIDGFKRYWAFKELGIKEIDCYVFNEPILGILEDYDKK